MHSLASGLDEPDPDIFGGGLAALAVLALLAVFPLGFLAFAVFFLTKLVYSRHGTLPAVIGALVTVAVVTYLIWIVRFASPKLELASTPIAFVGSAWIIGVAVMFLGGVVNSLISVSRSDTDAWLELVLSLCLTITLVIVAFTRVTLQEFLIHWFWLFVIALVAVSWWLRRLERHRNAVRDSRLA